MVKLRCWTRARRRLILRVGSGCPDEDEADHEPGEIVEVWVKQNHPHDEYFVMLPSEY